MLITGRYLVRVGLIAVGLFLAGERTGRALEIQNHTDGKIYVIQGYLLPKGGDSSPFPDSDVWVTEAQVINPRKSRRLYPGPKTVKVRIYIPAYESFAAFDKALNEESKQVVRKTKWYAKKQNPEDGSFKLYRRTVDDKKEYYCECSEHEGREIADNYSDLDYIWADDFYEFKSNTKITVTERGWSLSTE